MSAINNVLHRSTWIAFVIAIVCDNRVMCHEHHHYNVHSNNQATKCTLNGGCSASEGRESGLNKSFPSNNFRSLRIQPVFSLPKYLQKEETAALKKVLTQAISKITRILSVIESDGPLLLPRHACRARVRSGPNEGKCSRIQKNYSGERCVDNFKIPSNHLEGFATYNDDGLVKVYEKDGPGINNTDFVLYVTSINSQLCNPQKSSALAYAASCQFDKSGRPIAGQVNFCPRTLKAQKFDAAVLYVVNVVTFLQSQSLTAIHELFHTLGFSNKLFDKYRSCDQDGRCSMRSEEITKPYEGIMWMVSPAVVREMRAHFNCSTMVDFGGPLEALDETATSHWDPLLMHSSLMTSKEQKPYLTLIDRITLAVFEDTGWYQVNYSVADQFTWGKDQGCHFGFRNLCKRQHGFCNSNTTGCHYMRLSKARCSTHPSTYTDCGVFAADQTPCFMESNVTSLMPDEVISPSSRCFFSSLATIQSSSSDDHGVQPPLSGRCYNRKCENGKIYVRINEGRWILCPPQSLVQMENFYGSIECPTYAEVCTDFHTDRDDSIARIYTGRSSSIGDFESTNKPDIGETGVAPDVHAKVSAEIYFVSSKSVNGSILAVLKEALMKATTESKDWKVESVGVWTHEDRNQFHTHFCLAVASLSSDPLNRDEVRQSLSTVMLDTLKADVRNQMMINVNYDNLLACPSASFEGNRKSNAIPMTTIPLIAAIGLVGAIMAASAWINYFALL